MAESYGQFCPVAQAAEVLTERWTLLVAARAADGQHPLQRAAARRAADVLLAAQQTAAGDGALGADHAGAAAGGARPRLPADAGRGGARAAGRPARQLEPGVAEAGDQRRRGRPGAADVGHAAQRQARPPARRPGRRLLPLPRRRRGQTRLVAGRREGERRPLLHRPRLRDRPPGRRRGAGDGRSLAGPARAGRGDALEAGPRSAAPSTWSAASPTGSGTAPSPTRTRRRSWRRGSRRKPGCGRAGSRRRGSGYW